MATYQSFFRELRSRLQPLYDADEAAAIARLFLEQAVGISYTQSLMNDVEIPPLTAQMIRESTEALVKGTPVQYVLGRTTFMGHSFRCDARALIPRPETEELVRWVLADFAPDATPAILDVGTGTGCIAISLALALPEAQVRALDISSGALALARSNAEMRSAKVRFRQGDFLLAESLFGEERFDVVVSNPPYIPQKESESLHSNVRDHEPHVALFVPDEDALVFYRRLAQWGREGLNSDGRIYCETHRDYAEEVAALFRESGFGEVVVKEDVFGAPRMVRAVREKNL